jgi:hypothetical protein
MARRRPRGAGARRSVALWRYALAAVLGLSGRPARPIGTERVRRDRAASSFEAPVEAANELQFGRAYWLPPFGHGNGLDALFWTPVARLSADQAERALTAFALADIPAWTAPEGRDRRARLRVGDRAHDVWVASGQVDDAQEVLRRVLAA